MIDAVTTDALLGGRIQIEQPEDGPRAAIDAVLLQAAVPAQSGQAVVDLGAGSGAAGLCLAARAGARSVTLVDRNPEMIALAARNLTANAIAGAAIRFDVAGRGQQRHAAGLPDGGFDHAVFNPPFYDAGAVRLPRDRHKRAAHVADGATLEDWVRTACALVRTGGTVTAVHRPEALPALVNALSGRAGGIRVRPIHARADQPAIRILIGASVGSRAALGLLPALVLHRAAGSGYTAEAEAVLRAGAALTG